MRVLLAGASGALGSRLVPLLLEAGHEVIGVTRRAGSLEGSGATEHVADLLDRAAFLRTLDGVRADAIIHEATALRHAPTTFRSMRATNRLRAEGTSTLLAAARRIGAERFVFASVFYGYGFRDHGDRVLDETVPFGADTHGPQAAVQAALLSGERQVHAFGGVSLRYGLFYAPGAASVSPVGASWAGVLPALHRDDAARATVLALEHARPGSVYNVADEQPVTWRELNEVQARADGFRAPIALPEPVIRAVAPFASLLVTRTSLRMSSARARDELGWVPQYASIYEGLPAASA